MSSNEKRGIVIKSCLPIDNRKTKLEMEKDSNFKGGKYD